MTTGIAVLTSMATRQIVAELTVSYREHAGQEVMVESVGGVDAARRLRAGEKADVVILASNAMKDLEAEGHIVRGGRADFARSGIAMAVPAGAPRPDVGSENAVQQAMLRAGKVCYSTGPSGDHLKQLWKRWGIAEAMSGRAMQAPPGVPVATILARGEADFGVQQMSELTHLPGVDVLGPLPVEIQALTVFSAGICQKSTRVNDAAQLISFLVSPAAVAIKRKGGMEPA